MSNNDPEPVERTDSANASESAARTKTPLVKVGSGDWVHYQRGRDVFVEHDQEGDHAE
jgi:hypothetical protein